MTVYKFSNVKHSTTETEKINIKKVIGLVKGMNRTQIKNTFFDKEASNKDGYKWSVRSYMTSVMKFLINLSKMEYDEDGVGIIKRNYKYGKNSSDGRLYVEGMGLQSLQVDLKNYLSGEYYVDLDIVNCIPSLMYYCFKQNGLFSPKLEEYVNNREKVLQEEYLTKQDIIIVLNKDRPYIKKKSNWLRGFADEIKSNRLKLYEIIEHLKIKTDNIENPISSVVGQYLKMIESDIIQTVNNYLKSMYPNICIVNMFDGLNIERLEGIDFTLELENINKMFASYEYISFKYKSLECDIDLDLENNNFLDYEVVKLEFEKKHFLVKNPYTFWVQSRDSDGKLNYYQQRTNDFKLICEEYRIETFNDKGDLVEKSIFDKWIKDIDKRQYDRIDFLPYGKINTTPMYVYNTFKGFEYCNDETPHEEVDISNFQEYISNLCNDNKELSEYLIKYIAHIFQYPCYRTEQILVFKGWTGAGKDTLYRLLKAIIGKDYIDLTGNIYDVFGKFNSILFNKLALFINELEGKDGFENQQKLKNFSTGIENRVNDKNEKCVIQKNYIRLFIAGNSNNLVNIEQNDRRIVIFKTGMRLIKNVKDPIQREYATKFWNKFYEDMGNKNWLRSVFKYLIELDLSNYNPKNPPEIEEKKVMRSKNIKPIYSYIKNIIDNKLYDDFIINKKGNLHYIKFKKFYDNFLEWVKNNIGEIQFKIKQSDIKLDLMACFNSFKDDRRFIFEDKKTFTSINGRYCSFDLEKMKEFLDNYIFTEEQKEETITDFEIGTSYNAEKMSEDLDI